MARIVTLVISVLILSLLGIGRQSFAQDAKSEKENDAQAFFAAVLDSDAEENVGQQGIPIPDTFEDRQETATRTLELRVKNQTCRGVAVLVELASDCQFVSSAPLKIK